MKDLGINDIVDELLRELYVQNVSTHKKKKKIEHYKASLPQAFKTLSGFAQFSKIISIDDRAYRAVKSKYLNNRLQADNLPFSSEGSNHSHGRYHIKSLMPTLYFGFDTVTVAKECELDDLKSVYPSTILPVNIKLQSIVDLSNDTCCEDQQVKQSILEYEWRFFNDHVKCIAYSQWVGLKAFIDGFEGIYVRSVRRKAGKNLVLFPQNLLEGSFVELALPTNELKHHRILKVNSKIGA